MNTSQFIVCTIFISWSLFAVNAFAESSVWKVSKDQDYFYLGGTVHLLTAEDYPLPGEFNMAYEDSSEIIFETDLVAMQMPEFQLKSISEMTFSDNRTLVSEINAKIYTELEQFMASRQIPIANFTKFKPWGASLVITMLEYQRLGMVPDYGVDMYFTNLAISDSKIISSLETPEEQLHFLASLEKVDPTKIIEYTLRDLERLPEFIISMKNSWRSGDLETLSTSSLIVQMKIDFPEFYDTLVTKRNNAWMKELPLFIGNNNKEFVMVGAMHLDGEGGLLSQLKAQGFAVEQLKHPN